MTEKEKKSIYTHTHTHTTKMSKSRVKMHLALANIYRKKKYTIIFNECMCIHEPDEMVCDAIIAFVVVLFEILLSLEFYSTSDQNRGYSARVNITKFKNELIVHVNSHF